MGSDISSQPTFRSLGARKDYFYTDWEKAQLFADGIDKIKGLLTNANVGCQPRSIPELVRIIFDENRHDREIETIREAIRPTCRFGFHDMSATGTKLLACLAITQDPNCFGKNGELRTEYTKSVIRGWFSNGDTVTLDDSALMNIRLDSADNDKDGKDRIILGKNRLSTVGLYSAGRLADSIQTNRKAAKLGQTEMTLDLSTRPIKTVTNPFNEAALGDMHANSVMLLHQLVQLGFAEIQAGKEGNWDQLVAKIKTSDVNGFRDLLSQTLELKHPEKKLVLLGDLLSDRSFNDWFMLGVIDFLHEKNQSFDIIFSNHDAAFIEYYLFNKDKPSNEVYAAKSTKNDRQKIVHATNPNSSLQALNQKLNHDPSLRQEYLRMTGNYINHLSLLGCSEDQRSLYSHGVVNQAMMDSMLEAAGKTEEELENLGLQEKTRIINSHFRSQALGSLEDFHELFQPCDAVTENEPNPFYLSIWNTGPFQDNRHIHKTKGKQYLNADIPVGATQAVHGHTKDMKAVYDETEAKSLSDYKQLQKLMTGSHPPWNLQDWISNCLPLFINLENNFALMGRLGTMFTLFLDKARSLAASETTSGLGKKIDAYLKQCTEIPMHEVNWFNAYSSTDPNDPVMREKRRQNPQDPSKASYAGMSKDPTVQDEVKQAFRKDQNDALAKLKTPTQDLFNALQNAVGMPPQQLSKKTMENFSFAIASMQLNALQNIKGQGTVTSGQSSDRHAEIIGNLALEAIKAIATLQTSQPSQNVRNDMDNYCSLDGEFGKSTADTLGSRLAFLN